MWFGNIFYNRFQHKSYEALEKTSNRFKTIKIWLFSQHIAKFGNSLLKGVVNATTLQELKERLDKTTGEKVILGC